MLNALMELGLEIEGVELERRELAVSPEFRRVTTTVHLRGGGEEGLGEDVTYQADLHDTFPEPAIAGQWTIALFLRVARGASRSSPPSFRDNAAYDYRRWAWESAALDLALRQAGRSLARRDRHESGSRSRTSSRRASRRCRACSSSIPDARSSSIPARTGTTRRSTGSRSSVVVDTADFKGVYRGVVRPAAEPGALHADRRGVPERVARGSGARRRDGRGAAAAPATASRGTRRSTRSTTSYALPFPPRCLNVKPSRFGTVRRLFEFYEWCDANDVAMYGGGQFELGIGRVQIQELASLFHADMPNDVAPAAFNEPDVPQRRSGRRRFRRRRLSARSPDRRVRRRALASRAWSRRHSGKRRSRSR